MRCCKKTFAAIFELAHYVCMAATSNISRRLRHIRRQIEDLQAEEAVLKGLEPAGWLVQELLPNEKLSKRNVQMLIVLARVKDFLRQCGADGASTGEISSYLENTAGMQLNPATLRSHLSRFAHQGRIKSDKENRKWMNDT